jgi:hypothetical protein
VSGSFLRLYESLGGVSMVGFPLMEARLEDGLWVQYFEKVRFEAATEMDSAQLSKLGELYGQRKPPVRTPAGREVPGHSRYFPQTGHFVRQAFLAFYDTCNGQELLGNPIAEFTAETTILYSISSMLGSSGILRSGRTRCDWVAWAKPALRREKKLWPVGG